MAETYTCQHGGPGELVTADKRIFVEACSSNLDKIHKALLFRAPRQEIIATELVMLEELIKDDGKKGRTLRSKVDESLMKIYFGRATDDLLKTEVEEARINARMGVYVAMFLKHGDSFWTMTQQPPEVQKQHLMDFHTAIGQIESEGFLAKLLNVQTPCNCLEKALPSLKK